jgi:hypothetical protein
MAPGNIFIEANIGERLALLAGAHNVKFAG